MVIEYREIKLYMKQKTKVPISLRGSTADLHLCFSCMQKFSYTAARIITFDIVK